MKTIDPKANLIACSSSFTHPNVFFRVFFKSESESEVTCGQAWWPILGICALHLTHLKCTHTVVNTHTHREHKPGALGSQCCSARGAVGVSVPQGLTSVVEESDWRWKRALVIHSPHLQSPPDLKLKPATLKSDSLSIRPRLPPVYVFLVKPSFVLWTKTCWQVRPFT